MCKTQYHRHNFYRNTFCVFEVATDCSIAAYDYISKKGSQYYFTPEGVYRKSNHWGRVGNCRWRLEGDQAMQQQHVGYATWDSFYNNNDTQPIFYIHKDKNQLNFNHYLSPKYDGKAVLRNAKETSLALKNIHNIQANLAKYKKYYPQLTIDDVLIEDIVYLLIYTKKSLREILATYRD